MWAGSPGLISLTSPSHSCHLPTSAPFPHYTRIQLIIKFCWFYNQDVSAIYLFSLFPLPPLPGERLVSLTCIATILSSPTTGRLSLSTLAHPNSSSTLHCESKEPSIWKAFALISLDQTENNAALSSSQSKEFNCLLLLKITNALVSGKHFESQIPFP